MFTRQLHRVPLQAMLLGLFISQMLMAADPVKPPVPNEELVLNYHLMHPGGDSGPGDPNAAFCIDGVYHLHYILNHSWQGKRSWSFAHVTSPDMLHWTWQPTTLQPSFTGHNMWSGTGLISKEGKPVIVYVGWGSGNTQVAIAKDNSLNEWEKPYPIVGLPGDPDCFLIGDTYYAYSGGRVRLLKSTDLKNWKHVGNFMAHDMPDVAIDEDMSCGNFFKLGDKWMWLGISHRVGCRYYIGDWDEKAEQFVPQKHGRMNWQGNFFAPESVLTQDGRRVMWAWLNMNELTIQSLPRELSLPDDGILRIKPLRELESLRFDPVTLNDIEVKYAWDKGPPKIADLGSESVEIRISIPREEATRKHFGFILFADGKVKKSGLKITFRPENGTLCVGNTEAPFSVSGLPAGEDIDLRIFVDRYLVEVFVNDRQAIVGSYGKFRGNTELQAFTVGNPRVIVIKKLEIWKLKPTSEGFREAQKNRIWEPETK